MYVFDATPLVVLAKAERLDLLDHLQRDCITPDRVYDEVVTRGIERGYPDARRIERATEGGRLSVQSVAEDDEFDRLGRNDSLSDADAAVLALASQADGTAVMDERYGRSVAKAEGIDARGTAYVVLSALRDGVVDGDEARETIDELLDAGWYCSPNLYAKIRRKIETLADRDQR